MGRRDGDKTVHIMFAASEEESKWQAGNVCVPVTAMCMLVFPCDRVCDCGSVSLSQSVSLCVTARLCLGTLLPPASGGVGQHSSVNGTLMGKGGFGGTQTLGSTSCSPACGYCLWLLTCSVLLLGNPWHSQDATSLCREQVW